MSPPRACLIVVTAWLALVGLWLPASPSDVRGQLASGRILAVIGRQVGFLNLEAPRPRILTAITPPSFARDISAVPTSRLAVAAVVQPFGGDGELGGDLVEVDLEAAEQQVPVPLLSRSDASEWLGAPAWLLDGSAVLYQREDLRAGSHPYAGQGGARYPNRIEVVQPNGTGREVLVEDGHHPAPSPDGSEVAFVRLSARGSMLMVHAMATGGERTLVPPGTLPDLAYPRYAPDGDRVAFVATSVSAWSEASRLPGRGAMAMAHGQLWNLWVVQRDGSGLRELAPVGADDASVAWSPDGRQLLVYGSNGARLVDALSGETETLGYLAGFGAISWLP